jgi:hypothetical protein
MLTYRTDWHTDAQYKIRPQHISRHANALLPEADIAKV